MPQLGEIEMRKWGQAYIWAECKICGVARWTRRVKGVGYSNCRPCTARADKNFKRGADSVRWKGGKYKDRDGYIRVYNKGMDVYTSMENSNGYIPEHRIVIAEHLGRCLEKWEFVHHKNGIKDDNTIDNLALTTSGTHDVGYRAGYRDGYKKGFKDMRDSVTYMNGL